MIFHLTFHLRKSQKFQDTYQSLYYNVQLTPESNIWKSN